jgi:OOP family OmpA-OmpF porin
MNDGAEIKFGKNPLDPKDDLLDMTKGKKVVLEGIMFESAKATIRPESKTILTKVYESLQANPDVTVIIAGHTDSVGGEDSNRSLSLRRAQAVKDWLVDKGVDSARIKVIGKGEAEPIASNDTSDGRAKNRRIEFEIEK